MANHKKGATRGTFLRGFDPRRNIAGRPKLGASLAEKIRNALNETVRDEDGYTKLDALIDEAMAQAKAGHYQMLDILWTRAYGKVPEKVELAGVEQIDLSQLTDRELAQLEKIMEKAKRK
jgi:hypothetical protein